MLALVALFYLAIAILVTWPAVLLATTSLPLAPDHLAGDPQLVTYFLAWDADRIAHGLRGFWDAPILFPERHTLAFSEHMLGVALFTSPVQWITRNPLSAYNAAFVGSFVLAGVGMFLLVRELFGRADVALLAGLMFALSPYRAGQITHLQVLVSGWIPIALWCLTRYFRAGSARALGGFVASFVLQAWSNGYYLYFLAIAVVVLAVAELASPRLERRRLVRDLAIAALAIGAALAPFAWVYMTVQRAHGFARGSGDLALYSAQVADYFKVVPNVWNWGGLLAVGAPERNLFPGLVAIGLALVGASTISASSRRVVGVYALLGALAFWLSLGPGPLRPYGLLYRFVPGFNGIRVPARLVVIVDVALIVVAAAGAAWIVARLSKRASIAFITMLAIVVAVEGRPALAVDPFPPVAASLDRPAYEWLRDAPPGAVLELRIVSHVEPEAFTLYYQYDTLIHRHPIVNGATGWSSPLQEFLGWTTNPLQEGAVADTLRGLRSIGVRYVLVHRWTYDRTQAQRLISEIRAARDQYVEERQFGETIAWRLADAPRRPSAPPASSWRRLDPHSFTASASRSAADLAFAFDGDLETRWATGAPQSTDDWLAIRFPQPTDVARLHLESTPHDVGDYPRHLIIESTDDRGATSVLWDGTVVARVIEGIVADSQRTPIDFDFPPNRTTVLRLRQTGVTERLYWSVHELTLWSR